MSSSPSSAPRPPEVVLAPSSPSGLQGEPPATQQPSREPVSGIENRAVPRDKLILGLVALIGWILLFSAGLLIETVSYRMVLAPRSVAKQLGPEETKAILNGSLAAEPAIDGAAGQVVTPLFPKPENHSTIVAFVASVLCFTPINLALLTLVAGLAGGSASNIALATMPDEHRAAIHLDRKRYLQEPPVSAAIRGFIVYLCVIAGLYVAIDDPFKDPTPAQYIRLAGTLSVLAFLVGYDASRLEDWLRLIPSPGRGGSSPADQQPGGVALQARSSVHQELTQTTSTVVTSATGNGSANHAQPPIPETQAEARDKEARAEDEFETQPGE